MTSTPTRYKRFTILHSNDMHGDFMAEMRGEQGTLIGGLSLLSGYINQVRREERNVLFMIAGDMVQGSLIDSEHKGVSTIEIMNYLAPDIVTLGNHEFDYGLPHMLFLEKMANFPIVNANLYIKKYNKRLMQPYRIIQMDGLDILVIGIITEDVLGHIAKDGDMSSFISLEEASREVGAICNAYRNDDIDLTILMTHIGFESDKRLAAMLDPAWGVDLIIGGHSHTVLEQPAEVNGILIAQAGTGTDQVGRFDITVDDDTNSIAEWQWRLVPVDSASMEPDHGLAEFIQSFEGEVERKYSTVLAKLSRQLTHPSRLVETEMGNLMADAIAEMTDADVAFVGSGSIRKDKLGPVVTLGELRTVFPYDDTVIKCKIDGALLRRAFAGIMRPENRTGEGECYQVNRGVRAVYDNRGRELVELTLHGEPVVAGRSYSVTLQGFHLQNSQRGFAVASAEFGPGRTVSTSGRDLLEEWLRGHQNVDRAIEGRLVYLA